jgi:glycogen debranching enzyme
LQDDPWYNNDDEIIPYSNWRGPMWVNANAITCYGLMRYGFDALAMKIATRVTATLADDLRNTTQWHEAYSTADGASDFVCDLRYGCLMQRNTIVCQDRLGTNFQET